MSARVVLWTETAIEDLGGIIDHIATDSPDAAIGVLDRLQARAATLATLVSRGRVVPELREIGITHYREVVERPWRIVYRIETERLLVVAVLDSRRDLETLLLERLTRL